LQSGAPPLAWIAAITLFVLLEKLIPTPWISRLTGLALIAGGVWMVLN